MAAISTSRFLLACAVCAAVVIGVYSRFVGLGVWPFGVDEFYISRSIDHVLATGLPKFSCGGYYTRGLLYQYAVALLRMCGLSPELAARAFSAGASLVSLPAAYLLTRRLAGRAAAWLCVALLCLSVWEIEMARFARMYTLFQAFFCWYAVCFLSYVETRKRSSLAGMVVLSALGALSWEGGVFMGIANLLPPFIGNRKGRLQANDWIYLGSMLALLGCLYAATIDLRGFAEEPASMQIVDADSTATTPTHAMSLAWAFAFIVPAALAVRAVVALWPLRTRWLVAGGLLAALAAAILHQFLVCGFLLLMLPLLQLIDRRDFRSRAVQWPVAAIMASAAYWAAYAFAHSHWQEPNVAVGLAQHLIGFPNVLEEVARPWARSIPWMGLYSGALIAALTIACLQTPSRWPDIRTGLTALFTLIFAVGLNSSARIETRYTFFLYPLLMALSIAALFVAARTLLREPRAAALAASATMLILFAITEDFRPAHILRIDSARANFREGLPVNTRDHYYPRSDVGAAAAWLRTHVGPRDLVITGIPSLDPYYGKVDYFYLGDRDPRYEAYACDAGRIERWTEHRLLFGTAALDREISSNHSVYLVLYHDQLPAVRAYAQAHGWKSTLHIEARPGAVPILEISAARGA